MKETFTLEFCEHQQAFHRNYGDVKTNTNGYIPIVYRCDSEKADRLIKSLNNHEILTASLVLDAVKEFDKIKIDG